MLKLHSPDESPPIKKEMFGDISEEVLVLVLQSTKDNFKKVWKFGYVSFPYSHRKDRSDNPHVWIESGEDGYDLIDGDITEIIGWIDLKDIEKLINLEQRLQFGLGI